MVRMTADFAEIIAGLDRLEIASTGSARPAAQAGAQVFYDEVKRRVPVHDQVREYKGKTIQPGTLAAAIYQVYSQDNSDPAAGRATYHISWNKRKAPHGHLVEQGHKMPYRVVKTADGRFYTDKSKPSDNPEAIVGRRAFLRPAYYAVETMAVKVTLDRFRDELLAKMPEMK